METVIDEGSLLKLRFGDDDNDEGWCLSRWSRGGGGAGVCHGMAPTLSQVGANVLHVGGAFHSAVEVFGLSPSNRPSGLGVFDVR